MAVGRGPAVGIRILLWRLEAMVQAGPLGGGPLRGPEGRARGLVGLVGRDLLTLGVRVHGGALLLQAVVGGPVRPEG